MANTNENDKNDKNRLENVGRTIDLHEKSSTVYGKKKNCSKNFVARDGKQLNCDFRFKLQR